MALPSFSMGFLSSPQSPAVWLPLRGKHPRPSSCGEGHFVPVELEGGMGHEEIQLQLTMSAQIKGKIPGTSAVEDCTCSRWFYNVAALLDKAKHTQRCPQVPSIKFKKAHIEFQE